MPTFPTLRAGLAIAAAIFLTANAHAQAVSEEMLFADDPKVWATPLRVVAPQYPIDQLSGKARGYVDMEVALDARGRVKSSRIIKSEPQNQGFEKAAIDVISLWTFHETLSDFCVPVEVTANARIWFEERDGAGVVSVSGSTVGTGETFIRRAKFAEVLNDKELIEAVKYPMAARKAGAEARVYGIGYVSAATGNVSYATVSRIYSGDRATKLTDEGFAKSVVKALLVLRLKPTAGGDYKVCRTFDFRLN